MTITHEQATTPGGSEVDQYDVVVIGAGLTGLYQLYQMLQLGLNVRCFEYGGGVGGTWYWNRYPGCCFDSESETYSYSFSEELLQEWDWKEHFSGQPDNERYFNYVADKFDLRRHIEFNSPVASTVWRDDEGVWEVEIEGGRRVTARYVIGAVGILSAPARYVPDFPGLDDYTGEWYHTGRWPHEPVTFEGKRVGVIGTGSSGVQVITEIAKTAGHLTVFQRTPTFIGPLNNGPVSEETQREWKQTYPEIFKQCNENPNGFRYSFDPRRTMDVPKEERLAFYEYLWTRPGFEKWLANFWDITLDPEANEDFAEFIRGKIRERVKDPVVAEKLTPRGFPFGARRIPMENGYYEVFNQDNVVLVDVRETPIVRITPRGIETSDGEIELDMIVFATGFDSFTGGFTRMHIQGEEGITLNEHWSDGPDTYLGLAVAGFPNFFTAVPRAFCNFPRCAEVVVNWITETIAYMEANGYQRIVATPEAEAAWVVHQNSFSDGQLFASADSWFNGGNIPGKKKTFLLYANTLPAYRGELEEVAAKGYEGFVLE